MSFALPAARQSRVLLVDDDRHVRPAFARFLDEAGVEAESCADPDEALTLAAQGRFDGFAVDVMLTGGPLGLGLVSSLRACPGSAKAPILAMTGYGPGRLAEALRRGANLAVEKRSFKNEGIPALDLLCRQSRTRAAGAPRVLIVEDDPDVAAQLETVFAYAPSPYATRSCASSVQAAKELPAWRPHLLLLDLGLPGQDGLSFLPELAERRRAGPLGVIVVSAALGAELNAVCLRLGADDCLRKPFDSDELLARVEALLRRLPEAPALPPAVRGPLALDARLHTAALDGRPLKLTRTEFDILRLLLEAEGGVVAAQTFLDKVLGVGEPALHEAGAKRLLVHVSNLRGKLGRFGALIVNEPGVGYRLGDGS